MVRTGFLGPLAETDAMPHHRLFWGIALFVLSVSTAEAAEWIWVPIPREAGGQEIGFRKEFSLPMSRRVVKAELTAVSDFNDSQLFLNGQELAGVANFSLPLRQEIANRLRSGSNVLAIASRSSEGPSAVALKIELAFDDGTKQSWRTDQSWLCSSLPQGEWRGGDFQVTADWKPAKSYGTVEQAMLPDPEADTAINPLDDYTQWKQALSTEEGTDPSKFSLADGFQIERLRSAQPDEGSWVSLEFDSKGRLIIAREDRGLLRMTLPAAGGEMQVETIEDTLLECRGLLSAHGSLYASANNSKGLYRLRDTDGDDRFDETRLIYKSEGGVGHGRNDLALGPEGKISLIAGDSVHLPRNLTDRTSPFREHSQGERTSEGHVLRFDPAGENGEILAAGLRNPYGIAMHPSGELFTYDADAEYDMGSPWYRPTRIVHLTPGSDYGWRGVTKSWPPYFPDHADNAPPVLDIGKGSPTGVKFGTKSHFPKRYRESLFVSDWAYGRILAVSLTPRGASFVGRAHTFLKGQPFNVTDLGFGPDGAMYVVTGGRKTQSALYRVRYVGPKEEETKSTPQQIAREHHAEQARKLRHRLESLLSPEAEGALAFAWPHLGSEDPWIRYAARTVIEHQPAARWRQKAFEETNTTAALSALLALARDPKCDCQTEILDRLMELSISELTEPQKWMAVDAALLCLQNGYQPTSAEAEGLSKHWLAAFPQPSARLNLSISRLLAMTKSPEFVPRMMDWLRGVEEQPLRLHGLFLLRDIEVGWTPALRQDYFQALIGMREFQGGEGMPTFVRRIEADALAALEESARPRFETLLERPEDKTPLPAETRPFVREWSAEDLAGELTSADRKYDFERGQRIFREALCVRCHRVGFEGAAVGPDLTSVGRRFSRDDILESILSPSKVVAEQYRLAKIQTANGETFTGQIIPSRDYRSPNLQLAAKPLEPYKITEIPKAEIESHQLSETSVMPEDLLNHFTKEEIADLLAWLEAGGNPKHPNYR